MVFGCLDGFKEREQLEATTRRFLIPYIDIGLDVNSIGKTSFRMAGQIILSMPGNLCMRCLNFLNDTVLEKEAGNYGKAGPRPQVVWANGVLASTAIGVAVDLLTDWTKSLRKPVYLLYDANVPFLKEYEGLTEVFQQIRCNHYPLDSVGPPKFRII